MTLAQRVIFALSLRYMNVHELHVGDCIGADAEATQIAHVFGIATVCHPPDRKAKRAFTTGHAKVLPPRPYLERDRDMVDAGEVLIATPATAGPRPSSGTWYTIRYARHTGVQCFIIPPGSLVPMFAVRGRWTAE
jgi:hypothetical protein